MAQALQYNGQGLTHVTTLEERKMTTERKSRTVEEVVAILTLPGGGTFDSHGEPFRGTGFAVADPLLTNADNTDDVLGWFLSRRVLQALADGRYIGKWTDPETGKTEVNITDILEDGIMALDLATARNQKAVGHIVNGEYLGDIST